MIRPARGIVFATATALAACAPAEEAAESPEETVHQGYSDTAPQYEVNGFVISNVDVRAPLWNPRGKTEEQIAERAQFLLESYEVTRTPEQQARAASPTLEASAELTTVLLLDYLAGDAPGAPPAPVLTGTARDSSGVDAVRVLVQSADGPAEWAGATRDGERWAFAPRLSQAGGWSHSWAFRTWRRNVVHQFIHRPLSGPRDATEQCSLNLIVGKVGVGVALQPYECPGGLTAGE